MHNINIVRYIGLAAVSIALLTMTVAAETPRTDLNSYMDFLDQRQARIYENVPKKVLAFYYPWYGTPEVTGKWVHYDGVDMNRKEIASSTRYPATGPYDSHDPELVEYHMQLLKEAGIDGIIVSWWGINTFEDDAMPLILDKAEEYGIEISVYLEQEDHETSRQRIYYTSLDLAYILRKYGSHPAFLKVNDCPVVFVYGRVMSQVSVHEWMSVIQNVEETHGDFLLIADGVNPFNIAAFDGVHIYNPVGMVQTAGGNLERIAGSTYERNVRAGKAAGKISTVTVIPGYDDTKIRTPGIAVEREHGELYRTLWKAAIRVNPDWVLITSFNEWHEGSEIEPSIELGDKYIQLTSEFIAQFKAQPSRTSTTGEDNLPLIITENEKRRIAGAFRGKTIGILPDLDPPSPILLWLARSGIAVKILDHTDVAKGIDPRDLPVVVYAGGERYRSTLDETADIDRGLIEYLTEGGFLIAAPSQPWPFYYNEDGTVVTTRKLGIPIEMGWETPPVNLQLSFTASEDMLGNVAGIPFPDSGDLRWRPARPASIDPGDEYIPFLSLHDQHGNWYGDGAAYVRHETSPPKGGQVLYIWFRLLDQPGSGEFLCRIFEFVGALITG